MRNHSFRRLLSLLLPLVVLLAVSANFPHTTASVQRLKERTISRLPVERSKPISIVDVKMRGNTIQRGHGFLEGENWLEGLVIRIRNRSHKAILFVSIDLQFPRPAGSTGPFAVDELSYGDPDLVAHLPRRAESSTRMAPGQMLDLRLSARDLDRIKSLLTLTGYPSGGPEDVKIRIGTVIFSDGMMWRVGTRFRRASDVERGDWIALEEDELTGRRVTRSEAFSALRRRQDYGSKYSILPAGFSPRRELFQPLSYNVAALECGKQFIETRNRNCFEGYNCWVDTDYLGTNAGSYYLADAYGYCKHPDAEDCGTYQGIKVANLCTGGGGSGGGGGGGTEGGEWCYSDWDCEFGSHCGDKGICEPDWLD